MQVIDKVKLDLLFNDGSRGTGTASDMALRERNTLAQDGVVVAAVDVARMVSASRDAAEADPQRAMQGGRLRCKVRVTTRGMWTSEGELRRLLHECCIRIVEDMDADSRCAWLPCTNPLPDVTLSSPAVSQPCGRFPVLHAERSCGGFGMGRGFRC